MKDYTSNAFFFLECVQTKLAALKQKFWIYGHAQRNFIGQSDVWLTVHRNSVWIKKTD